MRISIGILAWNEAGSIARTIESLFQQTLFTVPDDRIESVEVVCVPNGCTDATAAVAEKAFRRCSAGLGAIPVRWHLHEVSQAGKANAWNRYIHEFSDPNADYLLVMDADVTIRENDGLHQLLAALQGHAVASVAVPTLIKSIELKTPTHPWHRLSLWTSDQSLSRAPQLSGALYCGRREVLRRIWLPIGVLMEDSFLRRLIMTDLLRQEWNPKRIVTAPGVSVVYDLPPSVSGVIHRNRRMALGRLMNALLCHELTASSKERDFGELIRQRNAQSNEWALTFVQEQAKLQGIGIAWRSVARRFRRRISALRDGGVFQTLARSFVIGGRILMDLLVAWMAYALLVRGRFRW